MIWVLLIHSIIYNGDNGVATSFVTIQFNSQKLCLNALKTIDTKYITSITCVRTE